MQFKNTDKKKKKSVSVKRKSKKFEKRFNNEDIKQPQQDDCILTCEVKQTVDKDQNLNIHNKNEIKIENNVQLQSNITPNFESQKPSDMNSDLNKSFVFNEIEKLVSIDYEPDKSFVDRGIKQIDFLTQQLIKKSENKNSGSTLEIIKHIDDPITNDNIEKTENLNQKLTDGIDSMKFKQTEDALEFLKNSITDNKIEKTKSLNQKLIDETGIMEIKQTEGVLQSLKDSITDNITEKTETSNQKLIDATETMEIKQTEGILKSLKDSITDVSTEKTEDLNQKLVGELETLEIKQSENIDYLSNKTIIKDEMEQTKHMDHSLTYIRSSGTKEMDDYSKSSLYNSNESTEDVYDFLKDSLTCFGLFDFLYIDNKKGFFTTVFTFCGNAIFSICKAPI